MNIDDLGFYVLIGKVAIESGYEVTQFNLHHTATQFHFIRRYVHLAQIPS